MLSPALRPLANVAGPRPGLGAGGLRSEEALVAEERRGALHALATDTGEAGQDHLGTGNAARVHDFLDGLDAANAADELDQDDFSFNYVVLDPKYLSQLIADLCKMRDYYSELVKVQEDKEQDDE